MADVLQNGGFRDREFTEIEYMLRKYYDEHCAKVVSSEVKAFDDRERLEFQKELQEHYAVHGYGSSVPFIRWDNKTADDLMVSVRDRLGKDAVLQEDIVRMTAAWRAWAVDRMGQEDYDRLSSRCADGDLAVAYVQNRMKQMVVEQLARRKVPKDSMEYIVGKAVDFSFISCMPSVNGRRSDLDERIDAMAEAMYDASTGEKIAGVGIGLLVDTAALGPVGKVLKGVRAAVGLGRASSAAAGAERVAVSGFHASREAVRESARLSPAAVERARKAAKGVGSFAAVTGAGVFLSGCGSPDEVDRELSAAVTGSADSFSESRREASRVKSQSSLFVHSINDALSNKVSLREYRRPFSPTEQRQFEKQLSAAFLQSGGPAGCHDVLLRQFDNLGVSVRHSSDIPRWMLRKTPEECSAGAAYYAGILYEMKSCGSRTVALKGESFSQDAIAQRAFDYARASGELSLRRSQAVAEEQQAQAQDAVVSGEVRSGGVSVADGPRQGRQDLLAEARGQWGGLMETLGLKGAGDLSHNLGYTLAMLPDMIFGMLTGRSSSLRIEDNVFPLMAIFGGMFLKNPLLKWTLIGLGAVNLLNKGFGEMSGRDARRQQERTFRRYAEEPLSPRVCLHGIRDDQVVMDIDGKANTVRISDSAAAAYRDGYLPASTLCNAIVKEYDAFARESRHAYELESRQQEEEQVVRMGVG